MGGNVSCCTADPKAEYLKAKAKQSLLPEKKRNQLQLVANHVNEQHPYPLPDADNKTNSLPLPVAHHNANQLATVAPGLTPHNYIHQPKQISAAKRKKCASWIKQSLLMSSSAAPAHKLKQWKKSQNTSSSVNQSPDDQKQISYPNYPDCTSIQTDLCIHTYCIIDILELYDKYMKSKLSTYSIYDVIGTFIAEHYQIFMYTLYKLQNDYRHIINIHGSNTRFMHSIIGIFNTKSIYCIGNKCDSKQRYITNDYYGLTLSQDILFINELDNIHRYFMHPLIQTVHNNDPNKGTLHGQDDKYKNEMDILQHECYEQSSVSSTDQSDTDADPETESDTDTDADGDGDGDCLDKSKSNAMDVKLVDERKQHDQIVNKQSDQSVAYNEMDDIKHDNLDKYFSEFLYDKTKRFYYWDSYQNDDRRDLFNGGIFSDWYIKPKYDTLKIEIDNHDTDNEGIYTIISNEISHLDKTQWKIKGFKQLIPKYELNDVNNIQNRHLISLKIYSDYPKIRRKFVQSFMQKDNETINDLKQKHSEYYHLAKNLREAVECFGDDVLKNDHFYHGILKQIYFTKPIIKFIAPTSCTKSKLTSSKLITKNGMNITLKKNRENHRFNKITYFDLSSICTNNNEILFIGGLGTLKISSLIVIGSSLTKYIHQYNIVLQYIIVLHLTN